MEIDKDTQEYFDELEDKIKNIYKIAESARLQGKDPAVEVEARSAGDLAARVEGLVGPKGIEDKIREAGRDVTEIIDSILRGDFDVAEDERIEQALRTSLAILTEGVVAAPIEGISEVKINKNLDGSRYLSIYFAGPIRSAGGTAQGLAVLMGDYIRNRVGLEDYRATPDEIERYVEEIRMYNDRITNLQYVPEEGDIRNIIKNLPVCVDGDPTEELEVAVHRDLERVGTNRIRGGICLVIAEGLAQKASKLLKEGEKLGLEWGWLKDIGKGKENKEGTGDSGKLTEPHKPQPKFMSEVVGGRPIFAAPSAKGAFRLRYGRSRASGIAAKSIHPATMILLDNFIATGTQVKVQYPGKGCIITPCDSIEGPIVKLKNGDVIRVEDAGYAKDIKDDVEEILFLGDILISFGDFLQTNNPLLAAGYCEEWWAKELENAGGEVPGDISDEKAIEMSKKYSIPLHPRYTYHWEDISADELRVLVDWLNDGEIADGTLKIKADANVKRILELLGVPHTVNDNFVIINEYLFLKLLENEWSIKEKINSKTDAFDAVKEISPVKIRRKSGTYIGARMGRPEKARERKMQPPVHLLFPIGDAGGRERSLNVAADTGTINVESGKFECDRCGGESILVRCPICGERTRFKGRGKNDVEIRDYWSKAVERVGTANVKAVKGMISKDKIPEPIDKGILRAKNEVYVFKDGTVRFDATDAPLTHFKPSEIAAISRASNIGDSPININKIKRLHKLGYTRDYRGNELVEDAQILELKVQDVIIPLSCAKYLLKVGRFIDELLVKFYDEKPFYNLKTIDDLVGHLVVGLAPHTSAGIIGRVIGFTRANVCYAHPYWHTAKRRNCFAAETKIPVLENGEWKLAPIKKLVENNLYDPKKDDFGTKYSKVKGLKTLTFNQKTKKFEIADITHVSKHTPQKTITLKTKSGREITTTLDHPFPTKNGKKIAAEVEEVFVPKNFTEKLIRNRKKSAAEITEDLGGIFVDKIFDKQLKGEEEVYSLTVPPHHTIISNGIVSHQCDGDEDTIMLLMDVLLNFSRKYLPESRGGKMDAPLVITTLLDPREVDDESHKLDVVEHYPLEFYEKTWESASPSYFIDGGKDKVRIVSNLLESNPYSNLWFSHDNGDITGPVTKTNYVELKTMAEKVEAQLRVGEKVRAIDEREVAQLIINSHFLRDTYGNLRAFSRQTVRCVKCNTIHRRPPLRGKCIKCGGRLLLTVTEGSIKKYLDISMNLAEKYDLPDYLKQRLKLLEKDIGSLFTNDLSKQISLSDFM